MYLMTTNIEYIWIFTQNLCSGKIYSNGENKHLCSVITHSRCCVSMHVCLLSRCSCVGPFATLWTVACQAPLSIGFSRQEYWSGLPFPSPGDLPKPGVKPVSLTLPASSTGFFTTSSTWEFPYKYIYSLILTVMLWTGNHYSHSRDEETKKRSSYRIPQGHTDIISPRARLALSSGLWTPCYPPPQNSETQMWMPASFAQLEFIDFTALGYSGFPGRTSGKKPECQCRIRRIHRFSPWAGKIPWRRAWQLTPVFLPGEPLYRGAWWATGHGFAMSGTQLKQLSTGYSNMWLYYNTSIYASWLSELFLRFCYCEQYCHEQSSTYLWLYLHFPRVLLHYIPRSRSSS